MKKKLKKLLKKALPVAALAAGATMLGRKRRQANEMKNFLATEGGNLSILPKAKRMMNIAGKMSVPVDVNANPREIDALVRSYGINTRADNFGLPIPKASMMASPRLNTGAFDIGMKDGGKVVKTGEKTAKRKKKIGIQIKGFGKARRS
tara:strand:- start:229 stop:675 length:447 start_codon:yes stop_codon:yes gene_type:complete